MRYNASVVRPPRERERFRMSEARDAADTEMLSANAPVWPGGSPTGTFYGGPSAAPRLARAVAERTRLRRSLEIYYILMTRPRGEKEKEGHGRVWTIPISGRGAETHIRISPETK